MNNDLNPNNLNPMVAKKKVTKEKKIKNGIYIRIDRETKGGKDTVQHTAETTEEAVKFIEDNT
jgi:hypothetical protein